MSQLTEILQNSRHLLRLEELKDVGRVSASVYEKLRLEYEAKNQDAIAEVYSGSVSQDKLQREVAIKCTTCGKKASYIAEYERWYCYKCKKYQPKPKAETGQQVP